MLGVRVMSPTCGFYDGDFACCAPSDIGQLVAQRWLLDYTEDSIAPMSGLLRTRQNAHRTPWETVSPFALVGHPISVGGKAMGLMFCYAPGVPIA